MVFLLSGPGALFSLSFLGFFLSLVSGAIVNRTIDDTFGDSSTGQLVTYTPSTAGVWKGKECTDCFINPDISRAFDETYTAATYVPSLGSMSITMQFTGTAIYVFFILANNAGNGVTTSTVVNFSLDGNSPQLYQHAPDLTTTDIDFNQLVYSQTNLKNTQHILVISTSGDNDIYVNFDYAVYTHDDGVTTTPLPATGSSTSSPSSSSSSVSTSATSLSSASASKSSSTTSLAAGTTTGSTANSDSPNSTSVSGQDSASSNKKSTPIGAIVGGVIGGIAVLIILIFFLLWRIRRREANLEDTKALENGEKVNLYTRRRSPPPLGTVDPFITTNYSASTPRSNVQPGGNVQGDTRDVSQNTAASPSLDTAYAYDGIADSSSDGRQRTRDSAASSSVLAYYGNSNRGGLRSVTGGDHLSSPNTDITTPTPTPWTQQAGNSDNVDSIRRARQQELNQRLRTVQEEMAFLTSDITGQKTGPQPVRRRRKVTRPGTQGTGGEADGGATGEVEESEMSMAEMREQLQMLRNQVLYLQEQQRSDWAQGLSNDPPPGYTPSNPPTHPLAPIPAQ